MNSKKLVIFSFVSLILFGLVLNFVFGVTEHVSSSSVAVTGDGYNIANWTKGNTNATVNFTLAFNEPAGARNVTNITITIPLNIIVPDLSQNGSGVSNGTFVYDATDGWTCSKTSGWEGWSDNVYNEDYFTPYWECMNSSATTSIVNATTMNTWFSFTANSTGTEEPVIWIITTTDDQGSLNTTQISTNIDGLAPRLVELNISDGFTTLTNGSITSFGDLWTLINSIDNGTLRGDGSLSVEATFEDAGVGSQSMLTDNNVYLYYLTNDTAINESDYENGGVNIVRMVTSNAVTPYKFTGTITGLVENNITTFVLLGNDSFNNKRYINNTAVGANDPFAVLTNTTNVPSLNLVNISISDGGGYNISSSSGGYLRAGTQTFTVSGSGRDLFRAEVTRDLSAENGVLLYYSTTQNLTVGVNGYVSGAEAPTIVLDNSSVVSEYSAEFNGTIYIAPNNDTQTLYYAIVANSTNGSYYNRMLTGQYYIDNSGPVSTAITSDDSDNKINVGGSITFTCSATDAVGVAPNSYIWRVTRGGESEVSLYTQPSTLTLSSTSSPSNTNNIDTYTIKCIPYDLLGQIGTEKSTTITVSASAGGTSSSGGGSSSSSVTPSFDVDLSISTTGSISGSVGRIKSFSFDGSTKHTVTFKEITATSAKITIASTPIDVVLNIGETKKVDINNDGTNDLEVTLDNIKFGTNAEITINKLEAGAKKVVEEETKITETGTTEETGTTGEPTKGTGWLWITLLIIVVLVTVGYYVFKKK